MKTKRRFLIVDDQDLIRSFLKDFLMRYELQTVEAANGDEAIRKWEEEDFNAILMDIQMPIMDGLQATRIIRRRERDEQRIYTPIYALSGYVSEDPINECNMAGMDGFIAKPVSINKLLDTLLPLAK